MEDSLEREEGEMSEDSMSIDDEPAISTLKSKNTIIGIDDEFDIVYRPEKEGLIIEKLERVDSVKIEERARRFGINLSGNKVISQKQIDELYENIGVDDTMERHIRFDTLHLKGVDGLTTSDIFHYLKDYNPVAVERINDASCNILCKDHISAALALLVNSKDINDEEIRVIAKNNPPHYWREGLPHPYSDLILMRFATNSDSIASVHNNPPKQNTNDFSYKNPWGDLCQSWGVYDHQEVYGPKLPPKMLIKTESGIIRKKPHYDLTIEHPQYVSTKLAKRLGKRQHEEQSNKEESESDEEWNTKSKIPRMRMRADDEEKKMKTNYSLPDDDVSEEESYPSLSIQIDNMNDENTTMNKDKTPLSIKFSKRMKGHVKNTKTNIHSRLGEKMVETSDSESSSNEDDSSVSYPETNIMSRVQKAPITIQRKKLSSVWNRLDKPANLQLDKQKDLRLTLKPLRKLDAGQSDLRTKLKEIKRRSPLRIEIDNEYYESD